jgi:hypothetical protein
MPIFEFSDEQVQQLTVVLANASGPGISWALTNGLLTTLQQQAQPKTEYAKPVSRARQRQLDGDGLDLGEANATLPRQS